VLVRASLCVSHATEPVRRASVRLRDSVEHKAAVRSAVVVVPAPAPIVLPDTPPRRVVDESDSRRSALTAPSVRDSVAAVPALTALTSTTTTTATRAPPVRAAPTASPRAVVAAVPRASRSPNVASSHTRTITSPRAVPSQTSTPSSASQSTPARRSGRLSRDAAEVRACVFVCDLC
jgi:hypothetical protein